MQENKSRISNVEWGLVISALFTIDLIQIALDWILLGGGLILNPFIDIFVGMSFGLYLQLRGEKLSDPKRVGGLLATLVLEMIPGLGELPLWGLDGLFAMGLSKKDALVGGVSGSVTTANRQNQNTESNDDDIQMAA